jgi:hypothetical protein
MNLMLFTEEKVVLFRIVQHEWRKIHTNISSSPLIFYVATFLPFVLCTPELSS